MEEFQRNIHVTTPSGGEKAQKPVKKKRRKFFRLSTLIIVILLVGLAGGAYYSYTKYNETKKEVEKLSTVQGQQELSKTQTQQLLGEMRNIIVLPDGEDPVVATITDVELLKGKEFYKDAQNDDRVVVFANAKKAYIYRPSTKTIVNVGAFQLDKQSQEKASQTPQPATGTTP
jgi:cytoskeletal protein RodZ